MKPPYFSLNIRLLFSDLFRIRIRIRIRNPDPKSGSEIRIRNRIRNVYFGGVPDRIRIRPKVSDSYGSGSGSATLVTSIPVRSLVYLRGHYYTCECTRIPVSSLVYL